MDQAAAIRQVTFRGLRAIWAPASVVFAHTLAAKVFGHEPYVDPCMHFLGGAAAAYFFRYVASGSPAVVGAISRTGANLLAFGLACAIALAWEFGEFFSDEFLGTSVQISVANTMRDLIFGVLGASAFLVGGSLVSSPTDAER